MSARIVPHFIAGARFIGASTRTAPVCNPASGTIAAEVTLAEEADCNQAIAAAEAAFPGWSATPPLRRARILSRYRQLVEDGADELAQMIASEHGKVLSDAHGEIARGVEVLEFASGIPQLLKGEYLEQVSSGVDAWTVRHPLGVCAGITPFNFPAMVPMWMFPVAIACGNTFILKPSERVPSTAVRLAELFKEAGLPDGVFNVLQGDRATAETLMRDDRIEAVSFVGSTPAAQSVHATAAAWGKRVQALGGAKNHLTVMPDADADGVVDALIGAAFGSAGERCMAVSVAVLVGDGFEPMIERLANRIRDIRIGAPSDSEAEMGALITAAHRDKVRGYIETGVAEGATLRVDGRSLAVPDGGFFLGGSLFDHVEPQMRIYREEIFGPVLCLVRVPTLGDAIALINRHEYGNGAALFTRDGGNARDFVRRVQAGMVGVNVPIPVPTAYHSFGGWKRSLFGNTHIYGPEGVRFYTRQKAVTQRWPAAAARHIQFSMPTNA